MLTLGYAYPNLVMAENYKETGQDQHIERTGSLGLSVDHALGRSGIYGLKGYERVELVYPNAKTNVLYPRTVLPTL